LPASSLLVDTVAKANRLFCSRAVSACHKKIAVTKVSYLTQQNYKKQQKDKQLTGSLKKLRRVKALTEKTESGDLKHHGVWQ
jgi:hypothetical protein